MQSAQAVQKRPKTIARVIDKVVAVPTARLNRLNIPLRVVDQNMGRSGHTRPILDLCEIGIFRFRAAHTTGGKNPFDPIGKPHLCFDIGCATRLVVGADNMAESRTLQMRQDSQVRTGILGKLVGQKSVHIDLLLRPIDPLRHGVAQVTLAPDDGANAFGPK